MDGTVIQGAGKDALALARVRSALDALSGEPTSKEAYAAMIPVLTRLNGTLPNGPQLTNLLRVYNGVSVDRQISLGSNGAAKEALNEYLTNMIARDNQNSVVPIGIPSHMVPELNTMLSNVVGYVRRSLEIEAAGQLEDSRKAMQLEVNSYVDRAQKAEADALEARNEAARLSGALASADSQLAAERLRLEEAQQNAAAQIAKLQEQLRLLTGTEATAKAAALAAQQSHAELQARYQVLNGEMDIVRQEVFALRAAVATQTARAEAAIQVQAQQLAQIEELSGSLVKAVQPGPARKESTRGRRFRVARPTGVYRRHTLLRNDR